MKFDPRSRQLGTALSASLTGWTQRSLIKSIQSGTVTVNGIAGPSSGTTTVTAVSTGNTLVFCLGQTIASGAGASNRGEMIEPTLLLTNGTTVTATVYSTADGVATVDVVVGFFLLEFVPGVLKQVQSGLISLTGAATSATATVTTVTTGKSLLYSTGRWTATNVYGSSPRIVLTNATTVTASRPGTGGSTDSRIAYVLAEWF